MENDEIIANEILFKDINGSSDIEPDPSNNDAFLAWQLAHNDVDQLNSPPAYDIATDNDRSGITARRNISGPTLTHDNTNFDRVPCRTHHNVPSHSCNRSEADDAQLAMQLDEQLKLTQEQEDAMLAQRLYEEERDNGCLNSRQCQNIRGHLLAERRRQSRNRPPRGGGDLEEDGAVGIHHTPAFARRQGRGGRFNLLPNNIGHHPFMNANFPLDESPGFPMFRLLGGLNRRLHYVDTNDYEALWELAEQIGDAKQSGISEEDISQLPTHSFNKDQPPDGATSTQEKCCQICLSEFAEGDDVKTLPCVHMYHANCIDRWLKRKGECPICRDKIKKN